MPRIVRFRMSRSINHRYDVVQNVGLNQPNVELDVLMVQFFLNNVSTHSGSGRLISITPDGICGSQTSDAIRRFQTVWNNRISSSLPRVRVDGVVSPAQGATFGSFAQHPSMTWTSIALNALVANEPNFGPDMYCRLHTHPDCPDALKTFFESAPPRQRPVTPALSGNVASRLSPRQRELTVRRPGVANERAAGLGAPRPALPVAPLRPGERARRTPARAYDPNDRGVLWARGVLSGAEGLFTPYEFSQILEGMEGTGQWSYEERKELLLQILYTMTGHAYPRDIRVSELSELLRQEAALGAMVRPAGRGYQF